MTEKNIRHVPVVDDDGALVGLVTHRDLLAASESALSSERQEKRYQRESGILLSQIMISSPIFVDERCGLRAAAVDMQKHKHGCLPVLRDGKLIGIITDSDYVTIAINLLEQLEDIEPSDEDFSKEGL